MPIVPQNVSVRGTLVLLAVASLAGGTAKADTFTATLSQTRTINFANPDGQADILYNGFDDTLGQLTGVSFRFQGHYSELLMGAFQFGTQPPPATGLIRTIFEISLSGARDRVAIPDMVRPITPGGIPIDVSIDTTLVVPQNGFGGVRNGPADVMFSVGSLPVQGGNSYYGNPGASGNGTLTYSYTPIPEPASLTLVAVAFTALCGLHRWVLQRGALS